MPNIAQVAKQVFCPNIEAQALLQAEFEIARSLMTEDGKLLRGNKGQKFDQRILHRITPERHRQLTHSFYRINGELYVLMPDDQKETTLGAGVDGKVKIAMNSRGELVVLKIQNKDKAKSAEHLDGLARLDKEIELLQDRGLLLGSLVRRDKEGFEQRVIVMPLMGDHPLRERPQPEQAIQHAIQLMWQVALFHKGHAFASGRTTAHLDIKPDNLTELHGRIQLVDYGFSLQRDISVPFVDEHGFTPPYGPYSIPERSPKDCDLLAAKRTICTPKSALSGQTLYLNIDKPSFLPPAFLQAHPNLQAYFSTESPLTNEQMQPLKEVETFERWALTIPSFEKEMLEKFGVDIRPGFFYEEGFDALKDNPEFVKALNKMHQCIGILIGHPLLTVEPYSQLGSVLKNCSFLFALRERTSKQKDYSKLPPGHQLVEMAQKAKAAIAASEHFPEQNAEFLSSLLVLAKFNLDSKDNILLLQDHPEYIPTLMFLDYAGINLNGDQRLESLLQESMKFSCLENILHETPSEVLKGAYHNEMTYSILQSIAVHVPVEERIHCAQSMLELQNRLGAFFDLNLYYQDPLARKIMAGLHQLNLLVVLDNNLIDQECFRALVENGDDEIAEKLKIAAMIANQFNTEPETQRFLANILLKNPIHNLGLIIDKLQNPEAFKNFAHFLLEVKSAHTFSPQDSEQVDAFVKSFTRDLFDKLDNPGQFRATIHHMRGDIAALNMVHEYIEKESLRTGITTQGTKRRAEQINEAMIHVPVHQRSKVWATATPDDADRSFMEARRALAAKRSILGGLSTDKESNRPFELETVSSKFKAYKKKYDEISAKPGEVELDDEFLSIEIDKDQPSL